MQKVSVQDHYAQVMGEAAEKGYSIDQFYEYLKQQLTDYSVDLAYLCDTMGRTVVWLLREKKDYTRINAIVKDTFLPQFFNSNSNVDYKRRVYGRLFVHHFSAYYYEKKAVDQFFEYSGFLDTINTLDDDGVPPIIWAARHGNQFAVDAFIRKGVSVVDAKVQPPEVEPARHYAPLFGDVALFDIYRTDYFRLIINAASVDVADPEGNTLFHLAVMANNLVSIKDFFNPWTDAEGRKVDRPKPDFYVQNKAGKTAYDLAKDLGYTEITSFFKQHYKVGSRPPTPENKKSDGNNSPVDLPKFTAGFDFKRHKVKTLNPLYKELLEDDYYTNFLQMEVLGKLENRIIATKNLELRGELERIKDDLDKKIKSTTVACNKKGEGLEKAKSAVNSAVHSLLKNELVTNEKIYKCNKLVEFIKGLLLALVTIACPFLLLSPGWRSAFYPLPVHKISCVAIAMDKQQKLLDSNKVQEVKAATT